MDGDQLVGFYWIDPMVTAERIAATSQYAGHLYLQFELEESWDRPGNRARPAVLSVLPDKIARFLYEYHDTSYTSLGLPPIPLDRSGISVHSILRPEQVQLCDIYLI